jgi:5-keto 4-deoxyuronate isomerase
LRVLQSVHPDDFKHYDPALIREHFLVDKIVAAYKLHCVYTHHDRIIIGAAAPANREFAEACFNLDISIVKKAINLTGRVVKPGKFRLVIKLAKNG